MDASLGACLSNDRDDEKLIWCSDFMKRLSPERFRNPTNTITITGVACYVTTLCVYANRYSYDANRFHE